MLWTNYYVRLDYLMIAIVALLVIAVIVWILLRRRIGQNVSDLHEKIDNEKVKYREMKQQMTNNIAHELRTPVSSIRGYLETLSTCREIDEEHRQMFIDRAYAQSIRLSDLIRDIALLTKIEEASGHLDTETLNLRSILDEVLDEFKENIAANGVIVENTLASDLEIMGNGTLIFAVFSNLIENSLKYGGNHITIHIECMGYKLGAYQFKYYDTGKGVARQHLKRIFERFYRASEGRTRDAGGSGLGLSIVRNAIDFHGGEITALAHHGGGLEYKFTLMKVTDGSEPRRTRNRRAAAAQA